MSKEKEWQREVAALSEQVRALQTAVDALAALVESQRASCVPMRNNTVGPLPFTPIFPYQPDVVSEKPLLVVTKSGWFNGETVNGLSSLGQS